MSSPTQIGVQSRFRVAMQPILIAICLVWAVNLAVARADARFDFDTTTSSNRQQFTANIEEHRSQTNSSSNNEQAITNHYVNSQAQKFRVNVSNLCDKNQMKATIRLSRPFYGLIHTKEHRKKSTCSVEGNGEQTYNLDISYTQNPLDQNFCGVVSHLSNQKLVSNLKQQSLSVALVVRLHKNIEFSDDRYFLLSCASRCNKADCDTNSTEPKSQTNVLYTASTQPSVKHPKSISASESIVSPVIRPSPSDFHSVFSSKASEPIIGPYERCDSLLSPKFHWLVKVCLVLVIFLLILFCLAFYLCASLNQIKTEQNSASRKTKTNSKSQFTNSVGQSIWCAPSDDTAENVRRIREDNANIAHSNQQHFLNNRIQQLVNDSSQPSPSVSKDDYFLTQYRHQPKHLVLGRSMGVSAGLNLNRQVRDDRVRRRRSIGGGSSPSLDQQAEFVNLARNIDKLSQENRAKSKSHLTIHYAQDKDPFEAVPFEYLDGSNYLPPATSVKKSLGDQQHMPVMNANPAMNFRLNPHDQSINFNPISQQAFANGSLYINPPDQTDWQTRQMDDVNQIDTNNNCQFDPQHSRQLIDLIQQKHRHHMALANRTAASINPAMTSKTS